MSSSARFWIVGGLLLAARISLAQSHDPNDYETILLPIQGGHYEPIPGAQGSRWRSLPLLRNDADVPVFAFLGNPFVCAFECVDPEPVPPETTIEAPTQVELDPNCGDVNNPCFYAPGNLYYAEKDKAKWIHVSTRAWDETDPDAIGAYIPGIRESAAPRVRTSISGLLIAPGARFRIRLYDFQNRQEGRHFSIAVASGVLDDQMVGTVEVVTRPSSLTQGLTDFMYSPGFFEADLRDLFPAIVPGSTVRLEVTPADESPFWFFVSATSADSRHISIAMP